MVDEKPNKYSQHESLPILTYDEAINSRPSSSQSFLGPTETSHDAERQGLLGRRDGQQDTYHISMAESPRSSLDLLPSSSEVSPRVTEEIRREMMEMEVLEPGPDGDTRRHFQTNRLSKHLTSLTHSLSAMHLPIRLRQWLPSRDYLVAKIPSILRNIRPDWIIVGRLFALLLVLSLAYLLFLSDLFKVGPREVGRFYPEHVRAWVRDHINATNIQDNAKYLTSFNHMAGTKGNYVTADWVKDLFIESNLEDVEMERFDVYLNFPKEGGRRVAIIDPPELAWEALIEEEHVDQDMEQTPVFHGHSRSGTVKGPLIYANYGSREDFHRLENQGINVTGAVALVRYYGSQGDRALKVKAAELAGAVGCIIYSDPAEDGFLRGKPYPDGRYMPSDGVQRGAVSLMSWVIGDVLSSGFASFPEEDKRNSKDNNPGLNNIPSIPLAWRDAQKLLQALQGHGMKLDDRWGKGGVPDVEWWTGDSSSPTVLLMNEQDEVERSPIYNVLGRITGIEQPEKSIVVGNHRDSWCLGGADPGALS